MKKYVIAIKDEPRSISVANRCIKSGKRFDLDIEIFPAFTPKDEIVRLFKREGLPFQKFFDRWSRGYNSMACFYSHYTLWKKCAEGYENYLILEHDAVFKDNIPNTQFKGLLSLGKPSYGKYLIPETIGVNKLVSKQYLPGAHAYIVKPDAAKALVAQAKVHAQAADVFIHNVRFNFLEEYYPWPVEVQENFSTVQAPAGCGAKHGYQKAPLLYEIVYLNNDERNHDRKSVSDGV